MDANQASGKQGGMKHISRVSIATLALLALGAGTAHAGSIQFFGTGNNDVDRIKIQIDPQVPADVGENFTIEFWMKGTLANNTTTQTLGCGDVYGWINGRTIFDRDRFDADRAFGISVGGNGVLAFGVNFNQDSETVCGSRVVLDNTWHHVAFVREQTGMLRIYVDGVQDASRQGPVGDLQYPDGAPPNPTACSGPCLNDPFIVLGAEKHDAGSNFPSFNGFIDELRISDAVQYPNGSTFTPRTLPFLGTEPNTAALYHFDEAVGTDISDLKGLSPGQMFVGGPNDGPQRSLDSPFGQGGPGALQFSQQRYSVGEGSGQLAAQVLRVGGSNGVASVRCTTSPGTAISPGDYTHVDPVLQWADGESAQKACNVPIISDGSAEGTETFTLTLSQHSGAGVGDPSIAGVDITESTVAGTLRFASSNLTAAEDAGTINVSVTRANGDVGVATVTVTSQDGSASAGTDYTAVNTMLTWNDGEDGTKTVQVTILNDATEEAAETFSLSLTGAIGGSIGAPSTATISINANDGSGGGGGGGGGGAIDLLFLLSGLAGLGLLRRRVS
jgi:hypothetical protein